MKLSEIKGKKQVKVIGRLMVLADGLSDDGQFNEFLEGIKGQEPARALLKLGPILERDDIAESIVDIVAFAKGLTKKQAEDIDILSEVLELLSEDIELPSFLSGQR